MSSQKIYKTYIEYYLPKLTMYNMYKNGTSDWTTCNVCDYSNRI